MENNTFYAVLFEATKSPSDFNPRGMVEERERTELPQFAGKTDQEVKSHLKQQQHQQGLRRSS